MGYAIDLDNVRRAAATIAPHVLRTPLVPSPRLSELTGAAVFVKHENMHPTGAFKERGAANKLASLSDDERRRGVIAMSAGNHAQAVAYHAARLRIPATIVMPVTTPLVKVENTRSHGARVVLEGETLADSGEHALGLADRESLVLVHPYDDPAVMAGQGTVAIEMLAEAPDLEMLVVPIGGGGLISGVATAAKALRPDIEIVGVQAALYPSMYCRISGEDRPSAGDTIAEGIAVKKPGRLTPEVIGRVVDEILLVSEADIETAVSLYLQIEKTVAEGAGAAGLAALLAHPERFKGRRVGLILTGGNIDTRLLATVLLRDLARSGRMARLRIQLQDRPGALLAVVKLFDRHEANIIEIYHQRVFTTLPAKDAFIDVECEARDSEHLDALVEALGAAGFNVHPVEIR